MLEVDVSDNVPDDSVNDEGVDFVTRDVGVGVVHDVPVVDVDVESDAEDDVEDGVHFDDLGALEGRLGDENKDGTAASFTDAAEVAAELKGQTLNADDGDDDDDAAHSDVVHSCLRENAVVGEIQVDEDDMM